VRFDTVDERLKLNHDFNTIEGVAMSEDMAVRATWPMVRLDALRLPGRRAAF